MGFGVFEAADVDEVKDVEGCDGVDGLHVHESSDEESEEVAVLSGSFEGFVELFVGGLEEGAVDVASGAGFFDDEDEWECEEDEESGGGQERGLVSLGVDDGSHDEECGDESDVAGSDADAGDDAALAFGADVDDE